MNYTISMKLPRRSPNCCKCEKRFEPGSIYFSQVKEEERSDYCSDCWQPAGEFWQGKLPPKRERSPDEKALSLFRKKEEFRGLLALYLERRKELALRPQLSSKEGRCYEVLETGELFHVPVVPIKKEALVEVSELLESAAE